MAPPVTPKSKSKSKSKPWMFLLALTGALVLAACSSDGDSVASPSSTEPAAPTDATTETGETVAPAAPATGSGWNIDAALVSDPNCAAPLVDDPLVIGYAADLGELGGFADGPASETAQLLARLINCSGGINGKAVRVDVTNIAGSPVESRAAVLGLVQGGAHVLLGPPFPDPGFRVTQVTNGAIPVIFTGSTEPALADDSDLSFLVAFNDTQGATAAAQFAQSQSWRTAATVSATGPYFGYNARVFSGAFTAAGGQVLADIPFNPLGDNDFDAIAAQIAANPPDVVYSPMLAEQWVAFKSSMAAVGLGDVDMIGSDAFDATFGYSLSGTDGLYHVTHTDPSNPDSRLERLIAAYTAATGKPRPGSPSMVALTGDAFAVIADAYLRVGVLDPLQLGQAIATAQGVEGVTGTLTYNNSGAPTKPIYIHQVVDGQPTLAYRTAN